MKRLIVVIVLVVTIIGRIGPCFAEELQITERVNDWLRAAKLPSSEMKSSWRLLTNHEEIDLLVAMSYVAGFEHGTFVGGITHSLTLTPRTWSPPPPGGREPIGWRFWIDLLIPKDITLLNVIWLLIIVSVFLIFLCAYLYGGFGGFFQDMLSSRRRLKERHHTAIAVSSSTATSAGGEIRGREVSSYWEHWSRFADQLGAELITGRANRCKVRKRFRNWTITLDSWEERVQMPATYGGTSYVWQTTLRAPYVRKDRFEFDTLLAGPVVRLVKFFRLNELPLIKFGSRYIQNHDDSKLRAFCANPKLLELVQSFSLGTLDDFRLRGRPDLSEGVAEIYFWRGGWSANESLMTLIELFEEVLNQLVVIGSASEETPNVVL